MIIFTFLTIGIFWCQYFSTFLKCSLECRSFTGHKAFLHCCIVTFIRSSTSSSAGAFRVHPFIPLSFIHNTSKKTPFYLRCILYTRMVKKEKKKTKPTWTKKTEQRTATILAPLSKPSHVRPSGRLTSLCIHRENNYTSSRLHSLM